jgi:hypothetical protein
MASIKELLQAKAKGPSLVPVNPAEQFADVLKTLATLNDSVGGHSDRLSAVEAKIDEIANKLNAIDAGICGITEAVKALGAKPGPGRPPKESAGAT